MTTPIKSRKEFLLCVDGRGINPNGDPNENRPRHFPDGQTYISPVRGNRYFRDQAVDEGRNILIAKQDGKTVTLETAIAEWAADNKEKIAAANLGDDDEATTGKENKKKKKKPSIDGKLAVQALCASYPDIRICGCSLAVPPETCTFTPKSLTGPLQLSVGLALHKTTEVPFQGTSVMASKDDKQQGTRTNRYFLRYVFYGWNGIVNERNAQITGMSDEDYYYYLGAIRRGIQNCNTHSKMGQIPRLLVSITNKEGNEHQFGNLLDYVDLRARNGIGETDWSSPRDFKLDLSRLIQRIKQYKHCIEKVEFDIHPDMELTVKIPADWEYLNLDEFPPAVVKDVLASIVEDK